MATADRAATPGDEGADDAANAHAPASPRADFFAGIAWSVFGGAVLWASLAMDRLAAQNINPVTIPGLLPALLGAAMMLLGAVLALRAHARGALTMAPLPPASMEGETRRRVAVSVALCVGFSAVLVGRGLPFWLAAAIFIVAMILVMQRMSLDPAERRIAARDVVKALAIGLIAGGTVHAVFQSFFLVRLP